MSSLARSAFIGFVSGLVGAALVVTTSVPGAMLFGFRSGTEAPTRSAGDTAVTTTEEQTVISTVEAAAPAVVSIVITKDVPVVEQFFNEIPGPFGNFEFSFPSLRQNGTERREIGGGSGFLVSADGLIVTNSHVVDDDEAEYTVFTIDGTDYEASVVARDPINDVAIIKIEGTNLPFLEFGDSDALKVGQTAIAIGNALSEFDNTVSVGVISGLARSIVAGDGRGAAEQLDEVIQTDAAINPGNSGGPLLNLAGDVVGVNVAVAQGSENIGFALPANIVRDILETVQREGRIVRPYIGVRYVMVTPLIQENESLSVDYGALVVAGNDDDEPAVVAGSPADTAGIVEGDVLLEVNGERLDQTTTLASAVRRFHVGDSITLRILHDGEEKTVSLTLAEAPQ